MKLTDPKFEEKWMLEFAARLRHRMEYLNINSRELAKRAGITGPAITSWLRRETTPTAMNIVKVAKILAVKPEYLIDFPDSTYDDQPEENEV